MSKPEMMNHRPIGIYEKSLPLHFDWPQRLDAAAATGFDFMEIAIDPSEARLARLDWSASQRAGLRNAIAATGVPIFNIILSAHRTYALGSASAQTRQKSLTILKKAVALAVDLGIRVIQLAGYFVFDEPHSDGNRDRFLAGLQQGVEWASQAGVMLGLENMDGEDITSIRAAMEFVDAIGSPWLQLYPDLGNLAGNSLDVCAELAAGQGRIVAIHLKDAQPGIFRRVPYGEGIVPFASAFRTLATMNFTGPVLLEMWNDDSPDALQVVADARRWIVQRMIEGRLLVAPQ